MNAVDRASIPASGKRITLEACISKCHQYPGPRTDKLGMDVKLHGHGRSIIYDILISQL